MMIAVHFCRAYSYFPLQNAIWSGKYVVPIPPPQKTFTGQQYLYLRNNATFDLNV